MHAWELLEAIGNDNAQGEYYLPDVVKVARERGLACTWAEAPEDEVHALVAAGEHRRTRAASTQEMDFGDAGAAVTVGTENLIAKFVGAHTETVDFVDHFRGEGEEFDYNWEERWIRDEGFSKIVPKAIAAVFEKTGVSAGDIDHFVMAQLLLGVRRLRRSISVSEERRPMAARSTERSMELPLTETAQAHQVLEDAGATGKIVLTV